MGNTLSTIYIKHQLTRSASTRYQVPDCNTESCKILSAHLRCFTGVHIIHGNTSSTKLLVHSAADDAIYNSRSTPFQLTGQVYLDRSIYTDLSATLANTFGDNKPEDVIPSGTLIVIENVESVSSDDLSQLLNLAQRGVETKKFNTLVVTHNSDTAKTICKMNGGHKFNIVKLVSDY